MIATASQSVLDLVVIRDEIDEAIAEVKTHPKNGQAADCCAAKAARLPSRGARPQPSKLRSPQVGRLTKTR
jgi:hypothetical protein